MAKAHEGSCYFEDMGISHDRGEQIVRLVRKVFEQVISEGDGIVDIAIVHNRVLQLLWTQKEMNVASMLVGKLVGQQVAIQEVERALHTSTDLQKSLEAIAMVLFSDGGGMHVDTNGNLKF